MHLSKWDCISDTRSKFYKFSTSFSNRPIRRRQGSISEGLLVAATTVSSETFPCFSNRLNSSASIRRASGSLSSRHRGQIASTSSRNNIQDPSMQAVVAWRKAARRFCSLSPGLPPCTLSPTWTRTALHSFATSFTKDVLPQPEGPVTRTPCCTTKINYKLNVQNHVYHWTIMYPMSQKNWTLYSCP